MKQKYMRGVTYIDKYLPFPLIFVIFEAVVIIVKYGTRYNLDLVILLDVRLNQFLTFSPNA